MKRLSVLVSGALVLVGLATGSLAQDKFRTKAIYTITTKNISVALSAHTSIPLTLGYWSAEGVDIEVTTLEGYDDINRFDQGAVIRQAREYR